MEAEKLEIKKSIRADDRSKEEIYLEETLLKRLDSGDDLAFSMNKVRAEVARRMSADRKTE